MDDITPAQVSIAALKQNITQAQLVAAEATTNPEILRELALFNDEKTREADEASLGASLSKSGWIKLRKPESC